MNSMKRVHSPSAERGRCIGCSRLESAPGRGSRSIAQAPREEFLGECGARTQADTKGPGKNGAPGNPQDRVPVESAFRQEWIAEWTLSATADQRFHRSADGASELLPVDGLRSGSVVHCGPFLPRLSTQKILAIIMNEVRCIANQTVN